MSEKIQVRPGWWRQRCGDVVRVWLDDADRSYPWRSGYCTYTDRGKQIACEKNAADLIEYLGETDPTLTPKQDDRRELIRRFAVALAGKYGEDMISHHIWQRATELADAEGRGGGT